MNKLLISIALVLSINTASNIQNNSDMVQINKEPTVTANEEIGNKCEYLRIKRYKQQDSHYSIDLQIPNIQNMDFVQLEKEINGGIKKNFISATKEVVSSANEDLKYSDSSANKYELVSKVDKKLCNNKVLSFITSLYKYTGGAHGSTEVDPVNISVEDKKEIFLKDLFKEGVDYKEIINSRIKSDIEKDKDQYYENESMMFNSIKDNQEFYITDEAIVVYFQEYAIAPYVKGNPEFMFSFEDYKEYLNIDKLK